MRRMQRLCNRYNGCVNGRGFNSCALPTIVDSVVRAFFHSAAQKLERPAETVLCRYTGQCMVAHVQMYSRAHDFIYAFHVLHKLPALIRIDMHSDAAGNGVRIEIA